MVNKLLVMEKVGYVRNYYRPRDDMVIDELLILKCLYQTKEKLYASNMMNLTRWSLVLLIQHAAGIWGEGGLGAGVGHYSYCLFCPSKWSNQF